MEVDSAITDNYDAPHKQSTLPKNPNNPCTSAAQSNCTDAKLCAAAQIIIAESVMRPNVTGDEP
jgi:hypothetical protein